MAVSCVGGTMRRTGLVLLLMIVGVADVAARPPPPPEEEEEEREEKRGTIEWSTWLRVAYGVGPEEPEIRARVVSPEPERDEGMNGWEVGAGADLTFGVSKSGNVRIGPWAEVRTSSDAVVGGELLLAARPKELDMFWYEGEGVWIVRAGGNRDVRTAAIAYGYRAPWRLWGPWRGPTRYTIGVRMVASITQSSDDRDRWSATFGLETEPVGALRYLLGIRSWY
jgi:hypothetical protein